MWNIKIGRIRAIQRKICLFGNFMSKHLFFETFQILFIVNFEYILEPYFRPSVCWVVWMKHAEYSMKKQDKYPYNLFFFFWNIPEI